MDNALRLRAAILSLALLLALLAVWQIATSSGPAAKQAAMTLAQAEYAELMGMKSEAESGDAKVNGFPTPAQFFVVAAEQLRHPFYDNGPNDKGIGLQLAYSLGRVALGYLIAVLVAIPLGFAIGMSPLIYHAFAPFIQVLKPISPLAWMPIALYTIRDSSISGIFVIFICSIWPILINTAFGVAGVRKDWLNVAKTLEVGQFRKAFLVILPAAAPTIITGMRISMGIAWLVIVAGEMLIGGTGIGYFVWNQWNNLSIANVIFAVLLIGLVGMTLDLLFGQLQKAVTYAE
ncbi:Nitrate ABC transporter, permease protein [Methylocella tundrae]|uniref:Nitrate ABC transporter, permease protein n=1 Tax=Methylocella tundrae TaxID=227605 RepID=A0A8B6M6M1_METTU|nr:nitrate ABC transporter permease [Methylocella tundrae]VTZ50689.1 Nitrate ABC transporter, permease protein [Methylocella tundrae]